MPEACRSFSAGGRGATAPGRGGVARPRPEGKPRRLRGPAGPVAPFPPRPFGLPLIPHPAGLRHASARRAPEAAVGQAFRPPADTESGMKSVHEPHTSQEHASEDSGSGRRGSDPFPLGGRRRGDDGARPLGAVAGLFLVRSVEGRWARHAPGDDRLPLHAGQPRDDGEVHSPGMQDRGGPRA
jgi:hypothetical protein